MCSIVCRIQYNFLYNWKYYREMVGSKKETFVNLFLYDVHAHTSCTPSNHNLKFFSFFQLSPPSQYFPNCPNWLLLLLVCVTDERSRKCRECMEWKYVWWWWMPLKWTKYVGTCLFLISHRAFSSDHDFASSLLFQLLCCHSSGS
jgi:hypothetical protein